MSDFYDRVLKPADDAEAYIQDLGGLPEISEAGRTLLDIISKTRENIEVAEMASRFPRVPSDYFKVMTGKVVFSPRSSQLIDLEGEAGAKKAELLATIDRLETKLNIVISGIVGVRADLVISQTEF